MVKEKLTIKKPLRIDKLARSLDKAELKVTISNKNSFRFQKIDYIAL